MSPAPAGTPALFTDLAAALRFPRAWIYSTWIEFIVRYRKTMLGPLWLIVAPAVFIVVLGGLFGHVLGQPADRLLPQMGAGLVLWTFISSIALSAPRLMVQRKPSLLQGLESQIEIVLGQLFTSVLVLLHQSVIIAGLMIAFGIGPTVDWLLVPSALALLLIHAFWVLVVFGILGARYRDLGDIVETIMRIAFLATPIMWVADPADIGSSLIGKYLLLNPFYHVLEPVRGALLHTPPMAISWVVSGGLAVAGLALAAVLYGRHRDHVVLWA